MRKNLVVKSTYSVKKIACFMFINGLFCDE